MCSFHYDLPLPPHEEATCLDWVVHVSSTMSNEVIHVRNTHGSMHCNHYQIGEVFLIPILWLRMRRMNILWASYVHPKEYQFISYHVVQDELTIELSSETFVSRLPEEVGNHLKDKLFLIVYLPCPTMWLLRYDKIPIDMWTGEYTNALINSTEKEYILLTYHPWDDL